MTSPVPVRLLLVVAVLAGAGAFAAGVARHPFEAWTLYLVNLMFWSGLSAAGVVFAALLELTGAAWAGDIRRLAARFAWFLPVSLALFVILLYGVRVLFPWVAHPPAVHPTWFTVGSFALRDGAAIVALCGTGAWFIRRSRAREREGGAGPSVSAAAVCVVVVYAVAFSELTVDLIMSLQPGWVSTLFPAYVFTGNLYGAIAAVSVAAVAGARWSAGYPALDEPTARDLGKLLLGFALLWLYLYWSQYLTIWYGNLPREFEFLVARMRGTWWAAAWCVLGLCFVVPFLALLARFARRPLPVTFVALACLAGLWLERLVLIAGGHHLDIAASWIGAGVTLAFAALFVLTLAGFSARAPADAPSM